MQSCDYDNRVAGDTRTGNWMQTLKGNKFWPLDPRPEEIDIEEIAGALSKACRFGGHCLFFYSVAEHSVHVSRIVPPEMALVGLLHDAAEAYVVDIPRPLKPYLKGYAEIEDRVWRSICQRFGLDYEMPPEVKLADNAMLLSERKYIMAPTNENWCIPGEPSNIVPKCWSPSDAYRAFIDRYEELRAAA